MPQAQQPLIPSQQPSSSGGTPDDETQEGATDGTSQDEQESSDGSGQGGGDGSGLQASANMRPRLIPGTDADHGDVPATPQENADLAQVVNKALYMIHGRTSRDSVLKQLHDPTGTVAQAVGRAAFNILMTVSDQKKAVTKAPVDEDVLHEALGYVVPELMTIGCIAGIFPFEAPPDESQLAPGQGNTEFDRQVRLAALEATKLYGEQVLKSPSAPARTEAAQNDWAAGIQKDVQSGNADPRFMKQMGQMRAQQPQQAAAADTDQGNPSDQQGAA